MAKNIACKYRRTATIEADAIYELEMHKSGSLIAVTLLTLVTRASAFANAARKPFVGICEGVVQLGFFIDGKVSVPAGKMHRVRSIGRYKCTFTDPEISSACPNGSKCRVMALMRGGNQFQILSVFGVARVSQTPGISPPRKPRFGPSDQPPARPATPQPM